MMENLYIILGVVAVVLSFTAYYWVGKVFGGMRHGRLMTAGIIVLFWIVNSIVNAGGISHLVWLIEYLPGFVVGWIGVLVLMTITALIGSGRPLWIFSKKEKWLI